MTNFRTILWAILFLTTTVIELRGEKEVKNGTIHVEGNATKTLANKPPLHTASLEKVEKTSSNEVIIDKKDNHPSRSFIGGGGGFGWGWGGGGGGGGGGGWGWGGGGGGGGWWKWGCDGRPSSSRGRGNNNRHAHNRVFSKEGEDYKLGEFAQCMGNGRCQGMRLDCPLHCGGPCYYDCQFMCKAHCP